MTEAEDGDENTNLNTDLESDVHEPSSEPEDGDEAEDADDDPGQGLTLEECLAEAAQHKSDGNDYFKAAQNQDACSCYELAVKFLSKHKDNAAARELLVSLYTNLAATRNKLELWASADSSATSALELDANNLKALFRRGVARFNMGQLHTAKSDLNTVCRSDTKNRDARTVLANVNARIQQDKAQERNSMSKIFSGKSLYHAEEMAAKRKQAEEARRKQEEEEEVRREWQEECARLRAEQQESAMPMDSEALVDGPSKAVSDDGADVTSQEATPMDDDSESAPAAADVPPISFEDFQKQREKRLKEEKEQKEAEEKEKQETARGERMRAKAKTDVVRVDDEEDLSDVVRGYKKRADGTTTTYFDRQVDEKTRTMLDQMKAPKRIDSQTDAQSESNMGSAWNKAGTWEEKDMTKWAQGVLKTKLSKLTAKAPMDMDAILQSTASEATNSSASSSFLNDTHLAFPLVARVTEVLCTMILAAASLRCFAQCFAQCFRCNH